jgi:hypothetical protein
MNATTLGNLLPDWRCAGLRIKLELDDRVRDLGNAVAKLFQEKDDTLHIENNCRIGCQRDSSTEARFESTMLPLLSV